MGAFYINKNVYGTYNVSTERVIVVIAPAVARLLALAAICVCHTKHTISIAEGAPSCYYSRPSVSGFASLFAGCGHLSDGPEEEHIAVGTAAIACKHFRLCAVLVGTMSLLRNTPVLKSDPRSYSKPPLPTSLPRCPPSIICHNFVEKHRSSIDTSIFSACVSSNQAKMALLARLSVPRPWQRSSRKRRWARKRPWTPFKLPSTDNRTHHQAAIHETINAPTS